MSQSGVRHQIADFGLLAFRKVARLLLSPFKALVSGFSSLFGSRAMRTFVEVTRLGSFGGWLGAHSPLRHLTYVAERRSDLEFLAPAEEIRLSPPSPVRVALALAICLLFFVAILVASFSFVDVYAVASGRIQPTGRSKTIQSLYTGTVRTIYVRNGSWVRAGQPLVELDPTDAQAERDATANHVMALSAEITRRQVVLQTVRAGGSVSLPQVVFPAATDAAIEARERAVMIADLEHVSDSLRLTDAKIGENLAQQDSLRKEINTNEELLSTLRERVEMRSNLQRDGWETKANLLDATETLRREQADQVSKQGQLTQAVAALQTLQKQKAQTLSEFISDYTKDLEKAEADRDTASQDLIKAKSKYQHTRLDAPTDGTVQQLTVTTIGQVLNAGEQIMAVVPNGAHLELEALVQNQDIGFVAVGQKAVVKIDSFPFTRYGTMSGTVVRVSRDSVLNSEASLEGDTQHKSISASGSNAAAVPNTQQLVYPVTIQLDSSTMPIDGKATPLTPGMSATVEIRTASRRVIEYLLSPFIKVQSEAIHER